VQLPLPEYPGLAVGAFTTDFPAPLGETPSPEGLTDLLRLGAGAPLERDEAVRAAVRDLLRQRGYKPTGRGKPASEYLVRAAEDGALGSINAAVDACNAVSLHSGLPISVVDLDRAAPPLRIDVAGEGASYVFNTAGQEIRLDGLLCLFDAAGPCANAVKDSQRTKTGDATRRTLSVVWAPEDYREQLETAVTWYRGLLEDLGATTATVETR